MRQMHIRTRKLKTTHGNFMPQQQHLYSGLACPEDYSIFAQEWTSHLQVSSCWHRNGLAYTDSILGRCSIGYRGK